MGSSNSKHPTDISANNNKITIAITQCLNHELYENSTPNKYANHHLTATVVYNGQSDSVSAPFTKNAIFERGVVQFNIVNGVNEFQLKLSVDGETGLLWDAQNIPLVQDNSNLKEGKVTLTRGEGGDGVETPNPAVDITYFYTFNTSSIVTPTRGDENIPAFINTVAFNEVHEGDIILYSGQGKLSNLIKNRFYRPYSHVGIVVRTNPQIKRGVPHDDTSKLYVLESVGPGEGNDPFRTRQSVSGVTLYPLEERIKAYEGHSVQLLRLNDGEMTPLRRERFITSVFEMHGARLPFDVIQASVLLFERLKIWNIQSNHSVFCSELVAIVLHQTGLIGDESYSPSNTDPGEVADFSCFNKESLKFLKYDL